MLYAWQHTLVDISPFVLPLAIASAIGADDAVRVQLINYGLVAMGIATLIQTTLGNRLPIVQGPSATLTGTLAPVGAQLGAPAMWGAAFVGAWVEAVLGASGALGRLRRLFPPLVSGIVVVAIGLSLGQLAVRLSIGTGSASDLAFVTGTVATVVALQVAGRRVAGGLLSRAAVFIAIWTVGLGVGGVSGRVDWALVAARPWFEVPRPFPFGGPGFGWEFGMAAIVAVFAGYLASMVESIGDYLATCSVAGAELEERHVDRGIAAEGVGCVVATCLGGLPCTSYTQNVGIIAATGVASRHVVRIAGAILLLYGLCPKFGALLVALPRPVLGGVFLIVCGLIVTTGMVLIGRAESSMSNQLVAGISLVVALGIPVVLPTTLGAEWIAAAPPIIGLVTTNPVVLAVILALPLNLMLNRAPAGPATER